MAGASRLWCATLHGEEICAVLGLALKQEEQVPVRFCPISKDESTTPSSVEEATVVLEEYALTGQDQPPDQPPETRIGRGGRNTQHTISVQRDSRKKPRALDKKCLAWTRKQSDIQTPPSCSELGQT